MIGYWQTRCNNLGIEVTVMRKAINHRLLTVGYFHDGKGYEFTMSYTTGLETVYRTVFDNFSTL